MGKKPPDRLWIGRISILWRQGQMLQLNPRILTNLIIYQYDWPGSGLIKADEV